MRDQAEGTDRSLLATGCPSDLWLFSVGTSTEQHNSDGGLLFLISHFTL